MGKHQEKGSHQRRMRNFLLDPRFQLKYTGLVVLVTVLVASALGANALYHSHNMTRMLSVERTMHSEDEAETIAWIEAQAQEEDEEALLLIVLGILSLALALGLTGIALSHRIVGPAYRLRFLMKEISAGNLAVEGGLRKGDELQSVGEAFAEMQKSLLAMCNSDIEALDCILSRLDEQAEAIEGAELREQLASLRAVLVARREG